MLRAKWSFSHKICHLEKLWKKDKRINESGQRLRASPPRFYSKKTIFVLSNGVPINLYKKKMEFLGVPFLTFTSIIEVCT